MLGAHEHDVLEKVGKSGPPELLIARANVVPRVDRDNRCGVVLVQNDLEAVGQLVLLELDTWD